MYVLTLTREERQAIDFVGHRYSNGNELFDLLMRCEWDDVEWDEGEDIEFNIPEHVAWEIRENAWWEDGDCEFSFPCFAPELAKKLTTFCEFLI
jgi:hypothetical protein